MTDFLQNFELSWLQSIFKICHFLILRPQGLSLAAWTQPSTSSEGSSRVTCQYRSWRGLRPLPLCSTIQPLNPSSSICSRSQQIERQSPACSSRLVIRSRSFVQVRLWKSYSQKNRSIDIGREVLISLISRYFLISQYANLV